MEFEGICIPEMLLGPLLNTLSHLMLFFINLSNAYNSHKLLIANLKVLTQITNC